MRGEIAFAMARTRSDAVAGPVEDYVDGLVGRSRDLDAYQRLDLPHRAHTIAGYLEYLREKGRKRPSEREFFRGFYGLKEIPD
jgi:ribosome modulation factor